MGKNKGVGAIAIVVIIALVIIIVGGIYFATKDNVPADNSENIEMEDDTAMVGENAEDDSAVMDDSNDVMDDEDSMTEGDIKVFNVIGTPFQFSVTEMRVKVGDTVRINFTNGQGTHDWVIDEFNARTSILETGKSQTIEFVADKTGTFEYYCSVGNHRAMGMVGKLIVE